MIRCVNNGNLPVDGVAMTDTLPSDAAFSALWEYDRNGEMIGPVAPAVVTGDYVTWDAGTIDNGDLRLYRIALDIAGDAAPGSVLVNRVEVSRLPDEDHHDDNYAEWVEPLYGSGPNLRVWKRGSWDDWGEDTRRASYHLLLENVGSTAVSHVTITDTYPESMGRDGGIDTEWGRVESWGEDPPASTFTMTYDVLWPGEALYLDYGAIVPGDGPLPFGLAFTNTAEVAHAEGETDREDNWDVLVLTTGPSLKVMKDLAAGDPRPGEIITFTLTVGNDMLPRQWWWNMRGALWLTDTLPAEAEFVTSTLHWCEGEKWCPITPVVEGSSLTWELWPFGAGEWNEIWVTARLSTTLIGGRVITNEAEVHSDSIEDVEWALADNVAKLRVHISHPGGPFAVRLPLVLRQS
jgi:hypothetical protein